MTWDDIYRRTSLEDLHWYPGEADDILMQAVDSGWLPGPAILDLGAGQGTDAIFLAGRGFDVAALDLSSVAAELALREAAKAGVSIRYQVGSALEMPFADGAFDAVSERGCFHHIALPDRGRYAAEVARVLKPGGVYFYRSFCWKSQFNVRPEEQLTEEAVRAAFDRHFTFDRFGEYLGRGQNGRSAAEMHWGVLIKK